MTWGSDVVVVVEPVEHSLIHLHKSEEEIHVEALIPEFAMTLLLEQFATVFRVL